jgi:hypothetical protein
MLEPNMYFTHNEHYYKVISVSGDLAEVLCLDDGVIGTWSRDQPGLVIVSRPFRIGGVV